MDKAKQFTAQFEEMATAVAKTREDCSKIVAALEYNGELSLAKFQREFMEFQIADTNKIVAKDVKYLQETLEECFSLESEIQDVKNFMHYATNKK